jgi:signal transduction histidine kinase
MPTYERHVLFVDDEAEIRESIQALLEAGNVHVTTAEDGSDALQQMQRGLRPDVIIADIEMPVMDGFAFYQAVRANDAWLPIPFIILTAHDDKANFRRAMLLGVDEVLIKPLDAERLLLTIYNRVKRTQELTRYAEAAQETLDFVRRDVARMFTHELKTPLVSLNMVTELLTRHTGDLSSQEARDLIASLEAGNTRLNRLLRQMELLIQLDTGELPKLIRIAARPGPLWDALTAAVSRARSFSYRQRDIPVHYDPGPENGQIVAEWNSLTHALAELLSNAMAFSPPDGVVKVRQWLENGRACLSISDSGPGIPESSQGDLFRRFHQVQREKHEQQGIGMGLYLSRYIVESMGGTLKLISEEGRGTTVTISFPLFGAQPSREPPPPPAQAELPAPEEPAPSFPSSEPPAQDRPGTSDLRASVLQDDGDGNDEDSW